MSTANIVLLVLWILEKEGFEVSSSRGEAISVKDLLRISERVHSFKKRFKKKSSKNV